MSDQKVSVELWDIDRLIPYENNAKIHTDAQIDDLAKSIDRHKLNNPITVDRDGVIIGGHGRRLALKKLGRKKVPVIVRNDLSKEEADALRLSDNQTASTDYDTEAVQAELERLYELEVDLDGLGYDEKELEFLTASLDDFDESAFVEDIPTGVEEQRRQNEDKTRELDGETVPVAKALGFKAVSRDEARKLGRLVDTATAETGKEGAAALIAWLEERAA
jgi:ParB-like chromosome segregation protein Spo0J